MLQWSDIRLTVIVCLICLTTVFPLYVTGYVLNSAQHVLETYLRESIFGSKLLSYSSSKDHAGVMSSIWAFYVALHTIGGTFGCLIGGPLQDKLGRRYVLLWVCALAIPAQLLQYMAEPCDAWYLLFVGRFISQLLLGIVFVTAPVYLNEIAKTDQRGSFGFLFSIFIVSAMVLATVFGFSTVLGTRNLFAYLFVPSAVMSTCGIPLFLWLKESPQFLAYGPEPHLTRASQSFSFFHSNSEDFLEAEKPILNSNMSNQESSSGAVSVIRLLLTKQLWRPVVVSLTLAVAYAITCNVLSSYSTVMLQSAGFSLPVSQYCTLGLNVVGILATVAGYFLVEKINRRHILITSLCVQAALWTILILFNYISSGWNGIVTLISFIVLQAAVCIGLQPLFFVIVPEIFPFSFRSSAKSLACVFNMIMSVIFVSAFFPCFAFSPELGYAVLALPLWICFIITWFLCPETRGLSIGEILAGMNIQI